jgi:hypothetical protein
MKVKVILSKSILVLILAGLLLGIQAGSVQATTLVSYSYSSFHPQTGLNVNQFNIMVVSGYYDGVNPVTTGFPLFDQLNVASLVQGQTYSIASNDDDPQFSEAAKTLSAALRAPYIASTFTDAGYIGIGAIGIMDTTKNNWNADFYSGDFFSPPLTNMVGYFEGYFHSQPSVFGQVDILPANVQSFNLQVDNLVITTDPTSGQAYLDVLNYTLFIDGIAPTGVPEPTTMLLLGLGLMGLAGARRKFQK